LLAGKKLLLADDSAAIRKVVELTFADEGMDVTTVGDGRAALAELELSKPDVVLADAFMPEIDGYELCRLIKQDERFAQIPVMLLVSSFDPFDEGRARRTGADDIVTKPFQSIRQLVGRVGSLLGSADEDKNRIQDHSMLGLDKSQPAPSELTANENVTVLVEAPVLETFEPEPPAGPTCSTDLELQTADTQRLDDQATEPPDPSFADTIEVEPVAPEEIQSAAIAQTVVTEPIDQKTDEEVPEAPVPVTDEPLLDIEPQTVVDAAVLDDMELDLDFQEGVPRAALLLAPQPGADAVHARGVSVAAETNEQPATLPEATQVSDRVETQNLSAEAIDAIAQRVVERMSDKVVREIAWEVVPELSELLIRRKLEEQK